MIHRQAPGTHDDSSGWEIASFSASTTGPRRKAMYWWSDFDRSEVEEEFDLDRSLGSQRRPPVPALGRLAARAGFGRLARLDDFETVCDAAADRGLGLDVTFFTGHMSGPNWAPGWLLDPTAPPPSPHLRQTISGGKIVEGAYRNMFHDRQALAASDSWLATVVGDSKIIRRSGCGTSATSPTCSPIRTRSEAGRQLGEEHDSDDPRPRPGSSGDLRAPSGQPRRGQRVSGRPGFLPRPMSL